MTVLELAKEKYNYLFEKQICPVCGKEFYFNKDQIKNRVETLEKNKKPLIACSRSCMSYLQLKFNNPMLNEEIKRKVFESGKNNIDEFGRNSYQRGNIKGKKTKFERHGNENWNNSEQAKITCLTTVNGQGLNIYQQIGLKSKESNLNNIDKDGLNGYDRMVIHCKESKERNHGDPNYNNMLQNKQTKLERHNNPNWNNREKCNNTKYNNIDEDGLNGFERAAKHTKEAFQRTRGVDNISQTQEWKDKIHSKREEINEKIYNTKKKNGTLNSSESEDMIHQFLLYKFKFEDIIHHYKDNNRYPFECDFYIKSLDLFIEINFYWTHGEEPFNKNNDKHIEKLNNWEKCSQDINFKQKKKDGYKNAIYIWTIDDPNKLKTFKKNNLNYKIFYNLDEFLIWFEAI